MGRILITNAGLLALSFEFAGRTWEEATTFPPTDANAKRVRGLLERVESEIAAGAFDYELSFPASPNKDLAPDSARSGAAPGSDSPTLQDFGRAWFQSMSVGWK